jgi:nitrite reductase (NADH) large subunit
MTASSEHPAPAVAFFRNYTQVPTRIPKSLWILARTLVLALTLGMAIVLLIDPPLGLRLFWGLLIPILPMILVIAPGLWRQVCPMAALNQAPRRLGLTRALNLPPWLRDSAFAIALTLFIGAVALRLPWFNQDARAVAILILGALALALIGGLIFKGRSGWCGTFCPLGPIQRTYGQAPLLLVRNGYCDPCIGCQPNCYDFNPRAAVFSDLYANDDRYASQRRLFMGLLPGLLLGYFLQVGSLAPDLWHQPLILLASAATSAGLYGLMVAFLPLNPYRTALIFGMASISIFYFFAGPMLMDTTATLLQLTPPAWIETAARGLGVLLALGLMLSGLVAERRYAETRTSSSANVDRSRTQFGHTQVLRKRLAANAGVAVSDRETGIEFPVDPESTLLEAIEGAGLKINYGCRAGVCGADPVAILEGAEYLSAPGEDEMATLRRLGLEGQARLACMCRVNGPILIDRDPRNAPQIAPTVTAVPSVDKARKAGIRRVVVIGNGVAGMSAIEALRRDSPSVEIDLVANEAEDFYNRMGIGRLLYDPQGMPSLALTTPGWAEQQRVRLWQPGVAARIEPPEKRVGLAGGQWLDYDKLIIATGARASLPEPDFLTRANAFVLRSAADARAIRAWVAQHHARRAVVIGGGVLGVEAADALRRLGLQVILLQRADRLMNAQLDERGAALLAQYLENIGIQVVTGVKVERFEGRSLIRAAWLAHGPCVRADLYVACLGIQANIHLAESAGLAVGVGIQVDADMRTSDPHIHAIGDVAEFPGAPRGLWPLAATQASAAAAAIYGESAPFQVPRPLVQLKSDGIDVRSLGRIEASGDEILEAASDGSVWWRLVLDQGEIGSALYVGPPGSSKGFMKLLQQKETLTAALPGLRAGLL